MNAKDLLQKHTHQAFAGDEEMSLKAALRGLAGEEAAWRPNRETSSIEGIVRHVAGCKVMYCTQAFGDCPVEADVAGGDLAKTLDWLDRAHEHLARCLQAVGPEDLQRPVPTQFHGESAAHLFWVLLMHDLCHGGQIQMIRREYRQRGRPPEVGGDAGPTPGWRVAQGTWTVDAAGQILGESPGNGYIYRTREHGDDVRVAARMRVLRGIELTVWICGSPENTEHDGYTLAVSTEKAKLQRKGGDMVTEPSVTIQPGKEHVLTFERRGARLCGFLDGGAEPFIEWTDPEPLRGPGHRTLGFYVWDGEVAISDIEVTDLSLLESA